MKKLVLLVTALLGSGSVLAASVPFSVTLPTQRTDNSALPLTELSKLDVRCQTPTVSATGSIDASDIVVTLRAPFVSVTATGTIALPVGSWVCYASVVDTANVWSDPSAKVMATIASAKAKAPSLVFP